MGDWENVDQGSRLEAICSYAPGDKISRVSENTWQEQTLNLEKTPIWTK